MRNRLVVAVLALAFTFAPVLVNSSAFDYINNSVTVTDVAQTLTVGSVSHPMQGITVYNPSASGASIYVKYYRTGETISPAVASATGGYLIDAGSVGNRQSLRTEGSPGYVAVSLVAAAGQTANSVRVWAAAR